jgi:hypothetical protein
VKPFASRDWIWFGMRPVEGEAQGAMVSGTPLMTLEASPAIVDVRMMPEEQVSLVGWR